MWGTINLTDGLHNFKSNYSIYELQSAGMVCFYTISRGTQPFSESTMTPDDIIKWNYDFSVVEDLVACHLVGQMLAH